MASTTLAARSSRAPTISYSSAQPHQEQAPQQQTQQHHHLHHHHHYHLERLTSHPYDSAHAFAASDENLHAHRQSHNASKLPAFRFADLRKDRISLSSLQHPPAPLAPLLSQPTADQPTTAHIASPSHTANVLHHYSSFPDRPVSIDQSQAGVASSRTRALKFNLSSPVAAHSAESLPGTRRPASDDVSATRSRLVSVVAPLRRRLTDSATIAAGQLNDQPVPSPSKTVARPDERISRSLIPQRSGQATEPAVPAPAPGTSSARASTAPSGRSSFESDPRRSDMPSRRVTDDAHHSGHVDAAPRDRVRRSLDSRRGEDSARFSPHRDTNEMTTTTDNDNTADIFMKIAGESSAPPTPEKQSTADPSMSRLFRTHRRPLSTTMAGSHETSPAGRPSLSRRLSEHRDSSRSRHSAEESAPPSREPSFRANGRESLPQISTTDTSRSSRTPQKPSPVTPRQISFKDTVSESGGSLSQRRRQSVTDNNSLSASRSAQHRSANLSASQTRIYQSSPLVPKSANVLGDGQMEANHIEGTESSSSTAAASVWDEVDDLKSRIARLEQRGKLSTAGPSDDRPRTATTNATTVSASPKRGGSSTHDSSTPRDSAHPLLLTALSKTKDKISSEVYSALESAVSDAVALSAMIPPIGQPGPISSRASAIGIATEGGVTDRQLRKKAESVCRSLTELCLALADEANQKQKEKPAPAPARDEALLSPREEPVPSSTRRPSAIAETIVKSSSSRAPSSLGEKRKTMLASIALPASSSRYATAPATPMTAAEPAPTTTSSGRKSSLLLGRIRRSTTTEEHEEPPSSGSGRRSSVLLRSRRHGSEEPEERHEESRRKTSLVLRSRKIMSDSEDESGGHRSSSSRVPSRAIAEVNSHHRHTTSSSSSQQAAAAENPATPSVLPRKSRMLPAAIATRFATSLAAAGSGSGSSVPATPGRKYLERSERSSTSSGVYLDRGSAAQAALAERLAEERAQMQQRQSQSASLLGRTGSLGRRSRDTGSGIPTLRS
ncbi:hypothetical protein VTJ04DRAFT_496 [Mycothermus thermophilus]|uniref:uncharacterized protein n=1 Tax=Humicola insolens TaxID=85995 RepID=UPI003742EE89